MSVTSEDYNVSYSGRGDTGPYAITFPVKTAPFTGDALNIKVWLTAPGMAPIDITATTSVSGLNVYTTTEYDSTYIIELRRLTPKLQPNLYTDNLVPATNAEIGGSFDTLTYIVNEMSGAISEVKGDPGDSAYQIWLDAGNVGTIADFLDAMKGETGATGPAGTDGTDGAPGNVVDGVPFYRGPKVITENKTITELDDNYMSIGPITIADGVTVTVDGGNWVIV